MNKIIEIKINGSHLTRDSQTAGVQHEANATALRMEFDPGWDGFAKTVTFWNARGENPVKRILTTELLEDILASSRVYRCPIPPEAMTEAGKLTYIIDGMADGVRQRSVEDRLRVLPAAYAPEAADATDPTPTQAEQLQMQVDALMDTLQAGIDASELAVSGAEVAAAGAQVAQNAAAGAAASQKAAAASEAAAKLAADQCEASVSGVASFNGRGGHVMPRTGDYTADMVGAAKTYRWKKQLTSPGWYRIAIPVRLTSNINAFGMRLFITGRNASKIPRGNIVDIINTSNGYSIRKAIDTGTSLQITAVRVAYDGTSSFVEVYYAPSTMNDVAITAHAISDTFTPIDFEPATEGETTTSMCDLSEWLNPPMQLGVEYRTTERWNGKPVYKKAISFGAAPNAAVGFAAHEIANLQNIAIESASMKNEDQVRSLPYHSETMNIEIGASQTNIVVQSDVDASGYRVYATVRYTKTTD